METISPILYDILHGNSCCFCLSNFYEQDGRTPTSKLFPEICFDCIKDTPIEFRRLWHGHKNVSYKKQRLVNKEPSDSLDSAFYGTERLSIQKIQRKSQIWKNHPTKQ